MQETRRIPKTQKPNHQTPTVIGAGLTSAAVKPHKTPASLFHLSFHQISGSKMRCTHRGFVAPEALTKSLYNIFPKSPREGNLALLDQERCGLCDLNCVTHTNMISQKRY